MTSLGSMRMARRAILIAGLTSLTIGSARGADLAASRKPVERLVGALVELVASGRIDDPGGLQKLELVIDESADLELLGRLSLGRHYRSASAAQEEEYQDLFRTLMLRKFTGYLSAYAGQDFGDIDDVLRIQTAQDVGRSDILVKSLVLPEGQDPLRVDWRLRPRNGEPVIIDVVVEGVSLLISQRSEFAAVIERGGIDALIASLRTQLNRST